MEPQIVELINLASVETDINNKISYLYKIKELAFHHGQLGAFFQDILAFQNERAPSVRKFILTFIEAACKQDCQLCPKAILSLNLLLNDTNTEVTKRSVQAATQFYRALVTWISSNQSGDNHGPRVKSETSGGGGGCGFGCQEQNLTTQSQSTTTIIPDTNTTTVVTTNTNITTTPDATIQKQPDNNDMKVDSGPLSSSTSDSSYKSFTDDVEKTWLLWLQMKSFICNLLETTNNDGIRTHCIKFIETLVLMQTPHDKYTDSISELNLIDPVIVPIKLSFEATQCGVNGLPKGGVLFNEEHKLELVEAAKKRFEQLVLFHGTSHISSVNLMAATQSLVVLAKQRYRLFMGRVIQAMESLHNRLPPTLTESQVQSVKKFLKLQLTVMLKHPYSLDRFQHQITQLLQAVGSKQPEIHKVISDFKHKFGCETGVQVAAKEQQEHVNPEVLKRIKLEPGLVPTATNVTNITTGNNNNINLTKVHPNIVGSQSAPVGKSKHLDLNKLTQELDEKEKRQIVVDSVRRILNEEQRTYISPAQMEIKKKVLSTLANEFHNTECPQIIQDYIFSDLRNRHEISYAIIRKNYDVAAAKAAKRNINLLDNQELLKNYFDCFNSYLNRAMDLKDIKDRDIILPKLYALRGEYYTITNQDQEQDDK